ncbi:hypothetical protein K504DRAFT_494855 [Pleomassaria siparia CBS 279.74]|uniref:HORMA domain-containing protein n=1 Tax=Pleomassaria siparia CBS 279.74 TaxID=1314801 RepID=A0A6G1JWR0_9PLEO|nr:hypothetical protein K504DRAFT_494855 [Pleomassaria siparia CBS 279.74]
MWACVCQLVLWSCPPSLFPPKSDKHVTHLPSVQHPRLDFFLFFFFFFFFFLFFLSLFLLFSLSPRHPSPTSVRARPLSPSFLHRRIDVDIEASKPTPADKMRRKQAQQTQNPTRLTADAVTKTCTETETFTNVTQSTEVMQTLVHGSISALLYQRGLLPAECFAHQYYVGINSHWRYTDYASGVREEIDEPAQHKGWTFRCLKKGSSPNGDALLKLLFHEEDGAFYALQRGFLKALQLSIAENSNEPGNVLETYTFTFHYTKTSANSQSNVEMTAPSGSKVTIKNARWSLVEMIRRVNNTCQELPYLPDNRYLTVTLHYNEKYSKGLQIEGFTDSTDNYINFPSGNFEKVTHALGGMDAGFHSTSLKISYLSLVDLPEDNEQFPGSIHNNSLTYECAASRVDDIDHSLALMSARACSQAQGPLNTTNTANAEATFTRIDSSSASQSTPTAGSGSRSPSSLVSPDLDLDAHQPFATPRRPLKPKDFVMPEKVIAASSAVPHLRSDDQITTRLLRQINQIPEPLQDTQTNTQATQSQALIHGETPYASELSQSTLDRLKIRSILIPERSMTSLIRRKSNLDMIDGTSDKVSCQCYWEGEENDDMCYCGFCDTWQHLHCYGYRGSDDQRFPKTHACYPCLLQGKEAELLHELSGLVLQRRALHILEIFSFGSVQEFANNLHCDLRDANALVQHLRNEDLLAKGSTITLDNSPSTSRRLMERYFDPRLNIAHHYNLPASTLQPTLATEQDIRVSDSQLQGVSRNSAVDRQHGRYPLRPRSKVQSKAEVKEAMTMNTPLANMGSKKRARSSPNHDADDPSPKRSLMNSRPLDLGKRTTSRRR